MSTLIEAVILFVVLVVLGDDVAQAWAEADYLTLLGIFLALLVGMFGGRWIDRTRTRARQNHPTARR